MHLELTEILACPDCGPGHGLIAFVDRMEERRIVEGRLDCPICERRHEILGGTVYLGRAPEGGAPPDRSTRGAPAGAEMRLPEDAAAMAAALLGPPDKGELLVVIGAARRLASEVAELRPDAAVVTYGAPSPVVEGVPAHRRVHPIVSLDPRASGLPFRTGVLDGAVLFGVAGSARPARVVEALSAGGRLVVLSPSSDALASLSALQGIEELGADARAWVGSRP